jgi:GR25 family glycosyltransferase involved in LPS biosynthesis
MANMKQQSKKTKTAKKLIDLYEQYQVFRRVSEMAPKRKLLPFTLDQEIESINPYYVRNENVNYG